MIFDSFIFAVFLPIVFVIYWVIPHRFRWAFLLVANFYFYMSGSVKYGFLLLATTSITYACGLMIEKTSGQRKKLWMWLGVIMTLSSLLFFKYFEFTVDTLVRVARAVSIPMDEFMLDIIMPLGISFYTFKAVSYIVDVYRGKQQAEHHFGYYAVFISYFPDVISGPIDRAEILLPQLKKSKIFQYEESVYALRLMLLGFAKKILLADVLTKYVDMIFNGVILYRGFTLMLASFLFTIQIYCDFSGYSDIAIGVSKLLGIDLMQNFKNPYFAKSIKEFWGRWHISLSTWFRDYVYIPLGGNRVSKIRRASNLMITFLVSGFWHGANYTYIIWGGIHGLYQIIETTIRDAWKKRKAVAKGKSRFCVAIKGIVQTAITFILVNFAWIFFRSNGLRGAFHFVTNMFADFSISKAVVDMGIADYDLWHLGILIVLLAVYDFFSQKKDLLREMDRLPKLIRWVIYFVIVVMVAVFKIHNGTSQQFIYFQF